MVIPLIKIVVFLKNTDFSISKGTVPKAKLKARSVTRSKHFVYGPNESCFSNILG